MTTSPVHRPPRPLLPSLRPNRWIKGLDAVMALIAVLNFGLVLFDLSYIRLRDVYLRYLPPIPQGYDWVKGIEPHRETTQYLALVDQLKAAIAQQGLQSAQSEALLEQLRDRSVVMIAEDPFRGANKSGSLEKIKNRLRQHMKNESAKESFRQFWSLNHLTEQNWRRELALFDTQIRPSIAANYFRPIDESGDFVDRFWQIDSPFIALLAVDLLIRVLWIRSRHRNGWGDALLWRWYDVLFFLPFWRMVRIIPVVMRLHQAGLINLSHVQTQVNRNLAENIAGEVAELVLLQTLSIAQNTVRQGALRQILNLSPTVVDTNDIDELAVIVRRSLEVSLQSVLPNLQPELSALIQHYLDQAIAQTPLSRTLGGLPGLTPFTAELAQQMGHQILQILTVALKVGLTDERGQQLAQQLGQSALSHLQTGLTQQRTLSEIETLLIDWIEELKVTLLQQLDAQDSQQTLAEAEAKRQLKDAAPVMVVFNR
ncbi:MAG: hypothetical protein WCD18_15260 [Thermosynechococcaceae cyanobacterium]